MQVFVAGATGAVGRPAVERLLADGHDVTAVARSEEKARLLGAIGARPAQVSLFDPAALRTAMAGAEAVLNLATHIPVGARAALPTAWREDSRIRTEGSRNLVDAALGVGAERFVQEGISFVYADGGAEWIDEDHPLEVIGPHGPVLSAADQAARFTQEGGVGVALRFALFYGDDELTRFALDRVRKGKPALMGRAEAYVTRVHVEDAASAAVAALRAPAGIYNVAEDEPTTHGESAAILAQALGVDRVRLLPAVLPKIGGRPDMVRSHRISNRRFRSVTGWAPAYPDARTGWPAVVAAVS